MNRTEAEYRYLELVEELASYHDDECLKHTVYERVARWVEANPEASFEEIIAETEAIVSKIDHEIEMYYEEEFMRQHTYCLDRAWHY